jgi:hypothetical protein
VIRPPIVGAKVWLPVMTRADYRCECVGACGSRHTPTGQRATGQHRCDRKLGQYQHGTGLEPLIVAPQQPNVPPHVAASTPTGELRAWCPFCYSGAVRAARRAAKAEPESSGELFDAAPFFQPKRRGGDAA